MFLPSWALISLPVRIIEEFPKETQDQERPKSGTIGTHHTAAGGWGKTCLSRSGSARLPPWSAIDCCQAGPHHDPYARAVGAQVQQTQPGSVPLARPRATLPARVEPTASRYARQTSIVTQIDPRLVLQKLARGRLSHAAAREAE